MQVNNEENNLDAFFEMIDLIEDDISEMLESESSELGGYECLIISFNCLTLFCRQVGIDFSQIEDHFGESEKIQSSENSLGFDDSIDLKEYNEVEAFNGVLEEIENTLAVFETRCKKTDELFDEWNCIFIMYTCLRKYSDKTKVNYGELIDDVSKLQSTLEKEKKIEKEDTNSLS